MKDTPIFTKKSKSEIKKEISEEIGLLVKTRRQELKLSQRQLADRIETSKQFIYKLEKGMFTPTISTLYFVARGLDWELEDIISKLDLLKD